MSYFSSKTRGQTGVVERPQRLEPTLFLDGERQGLDQLRERTLIDSAPARMLFQALVPAWYSRCAKYSLHGFAEYLPRPFQIGRQRCGVRIDLTEATAQRTPGDKSVAERDAQIAQHRGVGQVALPAGDRQLVREVAQQCVGNAEVALG